MATVTRDHYTSLAVRAAKQVLLELVRLLGEYENDVVIVGGWVPELLIPNQNHVGSTDIDLALNHVSLQDPGYATIVNLLTDRGYYQDEKQPFIFFRDIVLDETRVTVEVDFLSAEYGGTGPTRRTQRIQDIRARKARGADLVFEMNEEVAITGELPGGGRDTAIVRVASFVPFIVMKSMALSSRLKEKDARDIWFCLSRSEETTKSIIASFKLVLDNGLVRECLGILDEKFKSPDHVGPGFVADFEASVDPDEREMLKRDAFERFNHLFEELGVR